MKLSGVIVGSANVQCRAESIRPSVPARAHSSKPAAGGLLLWARPAGDIDRLLHGAQQRGMQWANAGSAALQRT